MKFVRTHIVIHTYVLYGVAFIDSIFHQKSYVCTMGAPVVAHNLSADKREISDY